VNVGDVPFANSKHMFTGQTKLRKNVGDSFQTPFECFQRCGGCNRGFVALLAQHSNDYAEKQILPNYPTRKPYGLLWQPITTKEMYVFLGIMLRISLSPIDGGGYPAYFRKKDMNIQYCGHLPSQRIHGTAGFAWKYMSEARFKQIRSAFHPEDKAMASTGGDKCYQ
jgi:Transposase IS4